VERWPVSKQMTFTVLSGLLAAGCAGATLALWRSSEESLLHEGHIFAFRDALAGMKAPSQFAHGALAYIFRDWTVAERELLSVARNSPWWSRDGFEAAHMLANVRMLSGYYSGAAAEAATLGLHDLLWPDRDFAAYGRFGDLTVVNRADSRIPYAVSDVQMYIPLLLNGQPANYLLDTGSNDSFMNESEARRLGLKVDPYNLEVEGYSETERMTGITATDLAIGDFRMRNVVFLVEPDRKDDPVGTIGLPVLLALETLRWGPDGILEVGFPGTDPNPRDANMGFARRTLLTTGGIGNGRLELHFDTGAGITRFYPRFRNDYTDYLRRVGHAEPPAPQRGVDELAASVPEMHFVAGGSERTLRPARVLLKNPSDLAADLHGSIGFDFLSQAGTVTLDFRAMKLTLTGVGLISEIRGNLVTCRLPMDLTCAKGWTCVVKPNDDGCQLDRLPDTPWPGNPIMLNRNPNAGAKLAPGFHLPEKRSASIDFRVSNAAAGGRK
jgi:hypothetical protein